MRPRGSLGLLAGALALAACGNSGTGPTVGGSTSSTSPSTLQSSSSSAAACVAGNITASGSTALLPLVQKAAQAYSAQCPQAQITVSGGGSSVGLSNVASGTSDIGDSDVPVTVAKDIDPASVVDHQVAIVVFAVIVNPQTGVSALSTSQVRDIFSGKVTNWKDVGGHDIPISLVERKTGSGTRLAFDKIIMQGTPESTNPASTQDSTQLVLQQVASSPGGVSYVAASSIKDQSVVAVTLDGARPTPDDVRAGRYQYFSHEHMYTRTSPPPLATSFIQFIVSDAFKPQVVSLGFLPVDTTSLQSAADR